MRYDKKSLFLLIFLIVAALAFWGWHYFFTSSGAKIIAPPEDTTGLSLPDGFSATIFAKDLTDPRVIAFDPNGRLIVSETSAGRVTLIDGQNHQTLLQGLDSPHGLAFYTNPKTNKVYLYVAEVKSVARYLYDPTTQSVDVTSRNIIMTLPDGGRHLTRTIVFGPNLRTSPLIEGYNISGFFSDTKLYVSVGSSCDVCVEDSWKYASILESDPEGTYTAELAGGLRNSVFFTFQPGTTTMWATEMGRDGLGDDLPPDEINIIEPGVKYGWPYCYGAGVRDTSFTQVSDRTDLTDDCSQTQSPAIQLPAHVAPLGLAFIPDSWPAEYRGDLLVAYHGSTQSSNLVGYKITRMEFGVQNNFEGSDDFITGWLVGDKTIGRPADLKFDDQGNLYISDDQAGRIIKVSHP